MRRPFVAGNWKMNGSKASIRELLDGLNQGIAGVTAEVAVCPPSIYLAEVAEQLDGSPISWGAQNLSQEASGAFTGEISPAMVKDLACTYVLVGHSERRSIYGEDDALVAKKFAAARAMGVKPILCVGETLEEREKGVTEDVVGRQLDAVLELEGISAFNDAVVAYEPVWAIGTGMTASPEQAQDVHAFIRQRFASHDAAVAEGLRIQYGGSVKGANAAELFAKPDIDGGLIGGASLDADEFLSICRAAS
ncbi:MAG: triose-phosphate isomerase [Gammaproteobacteria bacterium]|nr:triose-phosphate isomerase [Gammaproteobacteria bacterium]